MASMEQYDFLVLGSGEAGKYLAWSMASKGHRTALVERRWIGGSCPNIACLPSKNVIHSAKVASYMFRAREFGLHVENGSIDMAGVRARKRLMVDGLVTMHLDNFRNSGAELILGHGRFTAPKTIEVTTDTGTTRTLTAPKIILSTGSRATIPSIPGLYESQPLTHIEFLELDHIPEHLIVLGGGYIGLELAQAARRFGSRVTVLERNARLAHREDHDVTDLLHKLCAREGIEIITETTIDTITGLSGDHVTVHATRNGAPFQIEGSHLLAATGRTPNTENIGLDLTGVDLGPKGDIQVNDRLETTAEGIWAVGDCAGSPHFTHIAFDDHRIIRDNLAGGHRSTSDRLVPFCLFTDPEFARVGLSETEAREQHIPYRLAKIPMFAVLRTRTVSETEGFMKALIATDSDRILGFTAFGIDAGEVIAPVQLAITQGIPYTVLRDSTFTHPTIAEGLTVLFGRPLTTPKP
ncbi:FAD-dependent oxidoreductase [Granulicella sibirica]|uniref:PF00070 family, FAD-dependent NAD(P)-disulfide oxidoreductase n=1 Tax=Granulicella sibirica TaxID=2479048 RepID=A0A4V1L6D6_9BACT|nr:FAD-dependent oxidoreductase [Granulicella sibirica]RXH58894.1 PF00070 family, FAD-dependent NAD(P)-disulfide oxidoreductase [Granulicella sibirica]